ncbi:hypothetical protein [Falsiroseomonas sp. E2-1-a20]|uniref:hypothetical protein n=1 Tax=Falsiroseomonas sp. E2-1-a20 TaxID=3239300 RepID=UPI003F3D997A
MSNDAPHNAKPAKAEQRATRCFKLGASHHQVAERLGAAMAALLPDDVERLRRHGATFGAGNFYEALAIIATEIAQRSPSLEAAVLQAAATRDITPILIGLGPLDIIHEGKAAPATSNVALPAPRRSPGDPNDVEAAALPRLVRRYVEMTAALQHQNACLDAIHADTLPGVAALEATAADIQAAASAADTDRLVEIAPAIIDAANALRTTVATAVTTGDRVLAEVIRARTRALATVRRRPVEVST